jgi:hypothetical protein
MGIQLKCYLVSRKCSLTTPVLVLIRHRYAMPRHATLFINHRILYTDALRALLVGTVLLHHLGNLGSELVGLGLGVCFRVDTNRILGA